MQFLLIVYKNLNFCELAAQIKVNVPESCSKFCSFKPNRGALTLVMNFSMLKISKTKQYL